MQSPEFIVPEKMHYNKERLITEFEAALVPLTRLKNVNVNELITGLPLGPITKLEIIHFILYHFQRHLDTNEENHRSTKDSIKAMYLSDRSKISIQFLQLR
jgi:hypothetical protein